MPMQPSLDWYAVCIVREDGGRSPMIGIGPKRRSKVPGKTKVFRRARQAKLDQRIRRVEEELRRQEDYFLHRVGVGGKG